MKLKHLATIDYIVSTIFIVMMIPFWVPAYALQLLKKPFAWVLGVKCCTIVFATGWPGKRTK